MKDAVSATCDPYIDIYECMASADQSCAQDELPGLGRVDLIIGVLDHKMLWFFGQEMENDTRLENLCPQNIDNKRSARNLNLQVAANKGFISIILILNYLRLDFFPFSIASLRLAYGSAPRSPESEPVIQLSKIENNKQVVCRNWDSFFCDAGHGAM